MNNQIKVLLYVNGVYVTNMYCYSIESFVDSKTMMLCDCNGVFITSFFINEIESFEGMKLKVRCV
jgi:hypothetical protein